MQPLEDGASFRPCTDPPAWCHGPRGGCWQGPGAQASSVCSRAHQDPTSTFTKIYRRSLCLLQAWVEDCYAVDFTLDAGLLGRLQDFISSKVLGQWQPQVALGVGVAAPGGAT